jgi:hypothetical protein
MVVINEAHWQSRKQHIPPAMKLKNLQQSQGQLAEMPVLDVPATTAVPLNQQSMRVESADVFVDTPVDTPVQTCGGWHRNLTTLLPAVDSAQATTAGSQHHNMLIQHPYCIVLCPAAALCLQDTCYAHQASSGVHRPVSSALKTATPRVDLSSNAPLVHLGAARRQKAAPLSSSAVSTWRVSGSHTSADMRPTHGMSVVVLRSTSMFEARALAIAMVAFVRLVGTCCCCNQQKAVR